MYAEVRRLLRDSISREALVILVYRGVCVCVQKV